jgi:hypothetical protein
MIVEDSAVGATEIAPQSCPSSRLRVDTAFILWWLREGRLPPTLTTSSPASQGLLGQPDTRTLYSDDRLETRHGDRFNGVRLTVDYWLDEEQTFGIEGDVFFLERDSTYFKATSDGSTLLARPFVDASGNPASEIIAGPSPTGPRSGGFVGYSRIELFGEEANLVGLLCAGEHYRLEALGGARFLQMRDRTDLTSVSYLLPDKAMLMSIEDHYRTANAYYGGQLGLRGEWTAGRWSVGLRGLVGLGANVEQVRTFGDTITQTPTQRTVTQAGLTVQPGNSGIFDRTAVNLVSEAGLHVRYRLTRHLDVFGGYTFLLWDGALRSGDQIDLVVNQRPGTAPARPTIPFREDLFWAQGLNLGLGVRW